MKSLDCLDGVHAGCLGCACTCHVFAAYSFLLTCEAHPTQAEGRRRSDNAPWYFRARHGVWELLVGYPTWSTNILEWPGGWDEFVVASGNDPTHGEMTEAEVRALLNRHLIARPITDAHGYTTLFSRILPGLIMVAAIVAIGFIVWAVKTR